MMHLPKNRCVLVMVFPLVAAIVKSLSLERLNFQGMHSIDSNKTMVVRVTKNSSGDQALRVKRVSGAADGLCDSPQPRLQSLDASQELRPASSDFLEVALDCQQPLLGRTRELAELVAEPADGLRLDARPDVHLD